MTEGVLNSYAKPEATEDDIYQVRVDWGSYEAKLLHEIPTVVYRWGQAAGELVYEVGHMYTISRSATYESEVPRRFKLRVIFSTQALCVSHADVTFYSLIEPTNK